MTDLLDASSLARSAVLPDRAPALRLARRAGPFPLWLRVVDSIHASVWSGAAVLADLMVFTIAGLLVHVPVAHVAAAAVLFLVAFNVARVYADKSTLETQGVLWYPARVATPFAFGAVVMVASAGAVDDRIATALQFAIAAGAGLLVMHALSWLVVSTCRRRGVGQRPALIVGHGATTRVVADKLRAYPEVGLDPVGILSTDGARFPGDGAGLGALPADLPDVIRSSAISHVVLVPEGNHDVGIAECMELCDGLGVQLSMLPPLADLFLHPGLVTQVGGLPLISLGRVARTRSALPGKRAFDIVVGSALTLLTLPVMVIAAIAVKLCDGGPLFFRRARVCQGGETFEFLKFRSMIPGADQLVVDLVDLSVTDGLLFKVKDDPRITRVGRALRRLSIDELPQLLNVLQGDMSLVGPRPLAVDPGAFGALDGKRHSVPPGITGYWQIAGGNGLTYQEMVKLDLAYIQNWSLWLDIRLLARTVPAVFSRHRREPC